MHYLVMFVTNQLNRASLQLTFKKSAFYTQSYVHGYLKRTQHAPTLGFNLEPKTFLFGLMSAAGTLDLCLQNCQFKYYCFNRFCDFGAIVLEQHLRDLNTTCCSAHRIRCSIEEE